MYSTISQSTIITSPIGFNIALTNVDARLKQRRINVVPMLCNVVLKLFQHRVLKLCQSCATLKTQRWILLHFQRRINVISTLTHVSFSVFSFFWFKVKYLTSSREFVRFFFCFLFTFFICKISIRLRY